MSEEINTDDEWIAEFMGGKWSVVYWGGEPVNRFGFSDTHITERWTKGRFSENVHYSTSWDWLMPVVQKISEMHLNEYVTTLPIFTPIETVYNAVVEFIKWHNQSQNP